MEKIHKHIFWSPCVCCALNLIFKDVANALPWLRDMHKAEKNTVKYYINHTHILTTFRDHLKLELSKVAKTIFASRYTLLRHLLDWREQPITNVWLSKWKDLVKNVDAVVRAKVADIIKRDDFWWGWKSCVNEPINREDNEHCIQQAPSDKPKVRESNLKPLL